MQQPTESCAARLYLPDPYSLCVYSRTQVGKSRTTPVAKATVVYVMICASIQLSNQPL